MEHAPRSGTKPSPTLCPAGTSPTTKPPPASPPPRVPAWMEPAPSSPATDDAGWLILDRFVHLCRRRRRGVVAGDATGSSLAEDCAGRQVRASLRIADPPAVSRLYLHCPGRPPIAGGFSDAGAMAIAAHRNSILFRITVPFEDSRWWHDTPSFPVDYLVYSSSPSPSSSSSPPSPLPSLNVLPPCFHGGETADPVLDKFLKPHRFQQQRIMFDEEMGILCHGDNGAEFTVAHLTRRSRHEVELCLLHAGNGIPMKKWCVNKLQIPPDMKINLGTWRTDVVVPIGSRCLSWVDYYQGMLIVDVLAADSKDQQHQLLHYIRLPAQALKSHRLYNDAGSPDPFRRVCVTDAGVIKLVCIFAKLPSSPPDFTIITWTLVDIDRGNWTKDVGTIMGADKFFDLCNAAQSCLLPRVRPCFPVVSLVDPDVICFLLEEKDRNLCWMVEVNMRNKALQSSALYINEEEEEGQPSEEDSRNTFFVRPFIPTKFSSYLSKDAITSWKLSEMMQKAKEDLAGMQKAEEEMIVPLKIEKSN